jgi:hypothetical protein
VCSTRFASAAITTGEIFAAFPDLEPDTNELRELWDMFESRHQSARRDRRRVAAQTSAAPVFFRTGCAARGTAAPRHRTSQHRPGGTSAPRRRAPEESTNANADAELAVRSSAQVTHTEGGSFDPGMYQGDRQGPAAHGRAVTLAKRIEARLQATETLDAEATAERSAREASRRASRAA